MAASRPIQALFICASAALVVAAIVHVGGRMPPGPYAFLLSASIATAVGEYYLERLVARRWGVDHVLTKLVYLVGTLALVVVLCIFVLMART